MRHTPALAFGCLALTAGLALAGTAEVSYRQAEHFADAGQGRDAEQVQAVLRRHLQALAEAGLPAGQTLTVEFTDIDLAGWLRPQPRGGQDIRVLRGGADWPRLNLHFSLSDGTRTLASGDEELADMAYLQRGRPPPGSEALPYEQRLLSAWFARRFGARP